MEFKGNNILRKFITKEWYKVFFVTFIIQYFILSNANIISELLRGMPFDQVIVHHLLQTPKWLQKIFPLTCLISSLFAVNNLIRKSELTAIFAAGFSRQHFVILVILLTVPVAFAEFIAGGFLEPYANKIRPKLIDKSRTHFHDGAKSGIKFNFGSGKIWFKKKGYYGSFSSYNSSNKELYGPRLYVVEEADNKWLLDKVIDASKAKHISGDDWKFFDLKIHDSLVKPGFSSSQEYAELEIQLGFTPNDFKFVESDIRKLNIFGLYRYIRGIKHMGLHTAEYEVSMYSLLANVILCPIFALISLFGIFNPNKRSSTFGKNVVFILIFSILFWFLDSTVKSFVMSGKIEPILGSFSIPLMALIYLLYIFYRNRKLN